MLIQIFGFLFQTPITNCELRIDNFHFTIGMGIQSCSGKLLKHILLLQILILLTLPCSATIINVPSDDYPDIQSGIDVSMDGDTVLLAPGTYTGDGNKNVIVTDRDIVIMSLGDPEGCVIDCEEDGRAFFLESGYGKNIIFQGITFLNGYLWPASPSSGAALLFFPSYPDDYGSGIFIQCIFIDNVSLRSGGALFMGNTSLYVSDCIFTDNYSNSTGGAIVSGAGTSTTVIEDSMFIRNFGRTGGAVISGSNSNYIELSNSRFYDNTADSLPYGGAINGNMFNELVRITDCEFYGDNRLVFLGDEYPESYTGVVEISNCLLAGSSFSIDAWYHTMEVYISNCTIVDNGLGMLATYTSFFDITDCIIRGNGQWQVDGNATVQYSNIQDGYIGEGNIDVDPLFTTGPFGDYYLSQTAAGQDQDSPCMNTGSDLASNICITLENSDFCMDERTTRTDSVMDSDLVDMGYHYPEAPATHTPTPTSTATATPTGTPTLPYTFTPIPTNTPTSTCDTTRVTLTMPSDYYVPGDPCFCKATVCNATGSTLVSYPLFVVLDVYGTLFWGPEFTETMDSYLDEHPEFPPGVTDVTVIPTFTWPDTGSTATDITFHAALTDPSCTAVFGEMDSFGFGWGTGNN